MRFNLIGKLNYVAEIILNYRNWCLILLNRLRNVLTNIVYLRNRIVITGGKKSLILDLCSEIFIKEIYNPINLRINPGDTVVDIGANIGVFSLYASHCSASKIYAIEPLLENIQSIKINFKKNNFNNIKIINAAVSDKNGFSKLYFGDLDSHGLLFDHVFKEKLTEYRNVRTLKLDTIISDYGINHINFLKVDCEGSEGYILKSIKKDTWEIIDKIAIEYHDNVSVLSHTEMSQILKRNGYNTKTIKTGNLFGYVYAWRGQYY
jgi:FkbM family methyltransferase